MYGIYSQQTQSGGIPVTVTLYYGDDTSNILYYSIDGGDTILPTNINGIVGIIRSVKYINNKFYVLCSIDFQIHYIYESVDGITWTEKFSTNSGGKWTDFTYNPATNMVIITGVPYGTMRNSGGSSINTDVLPGNPFNVIEYVNGLYLLIGTGTSSSFRTSTDGITWTTRTLPVNGSVYGIQYMKYVNDILYGWYTNGLYYYDFTNNTWVLTSLTSGTTRNVIYDKVFNKYYFATDSGIYNSDDGITLTRRQTQNWTTDITSNDNDRVITSSTGSSRTHYSLNGNAFIQSNTVIPTTDFITYENDKFIAMSGTTKYTTTTGIVWTNVGGGIANIIRVLQVIDGVEKHSKFTV